MFARYSTELSPSAAAGGGGAGRGGTSKRIAALVQENGALAEQRQRAERANEEKAEAVAVLSAKIGKLMGAVQCEATLTELLRQGATTARIEVDAQRKEVHDARAELCRTHDQARGARGAAAKTIADASATLAQGFPEATPATAEAVAAQHDTAKAISEWTTTARELEEYLRFQRAEEAWYKFTDQTFDDALATAVAADMTTVPPSRASPDQLQALF